MFQFDPFQLRDCGCGRCDEGRFVALAAIGHRGEKGSIGLDQQPVERQVTMPEIEM